MSQLKTKDRVAIYELYARYCWALDTGDTDGYVSLFTEDAEATEEAAHGGLEVVKGHAEIRRLVRNSTTGPISPATSTRWRNWCSSLTRKGGPIAGWSAPMPGRRSTARPKGPISTGAAISATLSPRSTANGRSPPRTSWVGAARCSNASSSDSARET